MPPMLFNYLDTSHDRSLNRGELISSVKEILRYAAVAAFNERAIVVLDQFLKDPTLRCLPILKQGKVCGLLNRHRFMENHMVGRYGFGHSLNYYKTIENLLEESFLQVEQDASIEEVAEMARSRHPEKLYDDICVVDRGLYLGVVSVSDLLQAVMTNNVTLAIGANPLSGLPGNDFIQRRVRSLLEQGIDFEICYIDIDYFKPYNDKHGFAQGDLVIKAVAELLTGVVDEPGAEPIRFAGHIGGDDFILVTGPNLAEAACNRIVAGFENQLASFHGEHEWRHGSYTSLNRKGETERFPLLSLSIAIVGTRQLDRASYARISSVATELKKKAKSITGSAVLRDQRQEGEDVID